MLCRSCESEGRLAGRAWRERARRGRDAPPAEAPPRPIPDQLCTRCGRLWGADDLVERVHEKQSQLAQFGLGGPREPLLKPTGAKEDDR